MLILRYKTLGTVKLNKNVDLDKYSYSRFGIGFDPSRSFYLSGGTGFYKTVIIFGAETSSSMHTDNKNKGTLTLSKGPTDGLHKITFTAEKRILDKFC